MLAEFRVSNYKSIRDEQVLSLVAGRDKSLPANTIEIDERTRLLRSVALYGPNASGKSNILDALYFMRKCVVALEEIGRPGSDIPVVTFLLDEKSRDKPTLFEVTFFLEGIRHQYGFVVTRKRVVEEWLLVYPKRHAQTWFERKYDKATDETSWRFSSYLKGEKEKLKERTRDNALFLSTAAKWNHKQLSQVFMWFAWNLGGLEITTESILRESENSKEGLRSFAKLLQFADMGISGLKVEVDPDKTGEHRITMLHENARTGKQTPMPFDTESAGTQKFFRLMGPWAVALGTQQILIVDELESSLHPLLARELVRVMNEEEVSLQGSQLVFATHDTTLLDPALLRRDQVWFTEKNDRGATALYSLADYEEHRARKGEAMQKGYLSGRYGAIPVLDKFDMAILKGEDGEKAEKEE